MALKDGRPYLSFAVQGGDGQDQNLLQFFLNVVEWDMNVQQAVEAPNMNSYQLRGSFGNHETRPGRMLLQEATPPWIRSRLAGMGYDLTFSERTSGPINAIFLRLGQWRVLGRCQPPWRRLRNSLVNGYLVGWKVTRPVP